MDCCELALYNGRLAFWIAISAFGTIALLLLMLFGYNLWLDKRTIKLEKKNGHEQSQINSINSFLDKSNKQISQLKGQLQIIQSSLSEKDQEIEKLKSKS